MATAAEILVVEDEPELREMVAEYLARHGFAVRMAIDGEAMAARLLERAADLVILDINMPGEDGLTLARRLREHSDTCIMMLTAAGTTVDRVVGLEILHCEAIRSARAPRPRAHRIAPPGRCRVASRPAQSAARYPPSRTLAARCRRPQADWRGRSGTPLSRHFPSSTILRKTQAFLRKSCNFRLPSYAILCYNLSRVCGQVCGRTGDGER
jgi:CheY-like chemotaxis protein